MLPLFLTAGCWYSARLADTKIALLVQSDCSPAIIRCAKLCDYVSMLL